MKKSNIEKFRHRFGTQVEVDIVKRGWDGNPSEHLGEAVLILSADGTSFRLAPFQDISLEAGFACYDFVFKERTDRDIFWPDGCGPNAKTPIPVE